MGRRKKEMANSVGFGQYVDQCNGTCWGKQVLHKVHGKNLYYGTCKHECRLKEECIKASREESENIQFQLATVPYDPAIGDGEDQYNEDGEPILKDQTVSESQDYDESVVNLDEVAVEKFCGIEDFHEKFLKQHHIPQELYSAFREVTNQFFTMMYLMPKFGTVLTGAAVANMSQAEFARREGLTRQAISAGIATEIVKVSTPEMVNKKLDGMERVVFDLFRQGYSIRFIAKKMKISKDRVYRMRQIIVPKKGKSATDKKICLPRKKRGQTARKIAHWREIQKKKEAKKLAFDLLKNMVQKMEEQGKC